MHSYTFVLQFDPSEITRLATRYGYKQDEEAFRAGSSIAAGNYTQDNLNVAGSLREEPPKVGCSETISNQMQEKSVLVAVIQPNR